MLEEVFKRSGEPAYTFVEPSEYQALLVALRTPGRGVVIEGPSGVGKTTAVTKARKQLGLNKVASLSARRSTDRDLIRELPSMRASGLVIIDDFHRLDDATKEEIADYLKVLADGEDDDTKLVIIGINRAGETLLHAAPDLRLRLEMIRFRRNPDAKVRELVSDGATALNVFLPKDELVRAANGSFHLAQLLCYNACLMAEVTERSEAEHQIRIPVSSVRERVQDDLAESFVDRALQFAAGPNFSREGRAPYLHMLKWLSESDDSTISLLRELRNHPDEEASVSAVINGGHLQDFLAKHRELRDLIHFDPRTKILGVEDPKFFFYLKNIEWNKFAEQVGFLKITYGNRYDFALSFAAPERAFAEALSRELTAMEFAVFYDYNEQSRILAADIEAYLAPIYESEASFVVCVLGDQYPDRVWTRFEGGLFRARFGAEAVVPAWYQGKAPSMFDPMRQLGAFVMDPALPTADEAKRLADLLAQKVRELRLGPRVPSGHFRCKGCNLVLAYQRRAMSPATLCVDCADDALRREEAAQAVAHADAGGAP